MSMRKRIWAVQSHVGQEWSVYVVCIRRDYCGNRFKAATEMENPMVYSKWENQQIQFYISGQCLGLKTGGAGDVTPSVKLKAWEPGKHLCKSWSFKSQDPEAAMFMDKKRERRWYLVPFRPSGIEWSPATLVRAHFVTHLMGLNATLFLKHHLRNTHP